MPPKEGIKDLRQWFNMAVAIYLTIPVVLLIIGYPVGVYAVRHWLSIPVERIDACIWVLRITVVTSIIGMFSVPYSAMMGAYQLITEVVVFNLIKVIIMFVGAWCLLRVPGDRLIWYAVLMLVATLVMDGGIILRAKRRFQACKIVVSELIDKNRLKDFFAYTGFKFLGGLGWTFRAQGSAILINIAFGPRINSSFAVANQLSAQAASFSASLNNAISPAVTTHEGAGNREQMRKLALRSCKFGGLLVALFAIPLCVEIDFVLRLWLVNPPPYASMLCVCMLIVFLLEHITMGHLVAISAQPNIGRWQVWDAIAMLMALPIGIVCVVLGMGVFSVGFAYIGATILQMIGKVYFARCLVGMGVREWLRSVFIPLFVLVSLVLTIALSTGFFITSSVIRFCIDIPLCVFLMLIGGFLMLFDNQERQYIMGKVRLLKQMG